jgi:A/G-specific adenine glycosylase
MDFFNPQIHLWYSLFKRDLPWRNTRNAYYIWLSEIILQQTRIDQGISYYLKFIEEFPTIHHLAEASEDQVLKLWQGLGYYSRARNLHYTAKYLVENQSGQFPSDYFTILKLKGIGEYTASAIASISFGLAHATVDGNVYRVLSRFFGITDPIDTNSGKKRFHDLASELIQGTDPGMHNQAIMEFGALQCTPKKPNCPDCPLQEKCFAFGAGKVGELPVKQNKTRQRDRYFNYLVFATTECTWLRKRTGNDIWKNLFEFPMIETSEKTDPTYLFTQKDFLDFGNLLEIVVENVSKWKVHILSHQRIYYRFILFGLPDKSILPGNLFPVNKKDIYNFAVPKLLESYLNENGGNGLFVRQNEGFITNFG